MSSVNSILKSFFRKRLRAIDDFMQNGLEVQSRVFKEIMVQEGVRYLNRYDVDCNDCYETFAQKIPIVSYEDIADELIESTKCGSIMCSDKVLWVAKSSGTTNDKSKFIPITRVYLTNCHYRGVKDVIATVIRNYPQTKAYTGKSLTLGGSQAVFSQSDVIVGDLSAILIDNAPWYAGILREPSKNIALMPNFEQKVEQICRTVVNKNVTSFAGVPSWNLVLMKRVLEYTNKKNLLEVWPNLSLFMHGGIAFDPYREQFETVIPTDNMKYIETYNASEGFFAMQDTLDPNDGMLLMLDYGVFYEFLPVDQLDNHSAAVPLAGVQQGVVYAMIITNSSGLWRYLLGDTVVFISISPYRIKIVGRTKQFINAFGEELMVGNTNAALKKACGMTGAVINEYTVAPVFMEGDNKGRHQWLVEFSTVPEDLSLFVDLLDEELQNVNSDYMAKRANNATMDKLLLNVVPNGTFFRWMTQRGKQGGQNKVPRLSADRKYVEQLLTYIK